MIPTMRYALLLSLSLFVALPCAANTLDAIQQLLLKPTAMHGQFTQEKKITVLKQPLISNGQFWLAQNKGLVWKTENPITSELIITETDVQFSEQLSGNMERSMRHISNIFNALLNADFTELEKQFEITHSEIHADNHWQLKLSPKSLLIKKALAEITVKGSTSLSSILLTEKSGDHTFININNVTHFDQIPNTLADKLAGSTQAKQ